MSPGPGVARGRPSGKPKNAPPTLPYAPPADDVRVQPCETEGELEAFIRFQLDHYRDDPYFVPPLVVERKDFLSPQRNTFFAHGRAAFFLARRGSATVGRIAAILDERYRRYHGVDQGFFGLFDCVNDAGVASALLQRAAAWTRAQGAREMIGPIGLAFHYECGLLVEGFHASPSMMMPYNHRYYRELLETNGFVKMKDLWSFDFDARQALPEKITRTADRLRRAGLVRLRRFRFRDAPGEALHVKRIFDSMLRPGWGFVPMPADEFEQLVLRLQPLIFLRPELSFFAEVGGEPVAFSITVPEMNDAFRRAGGALTTWGIPLGLARILWGARQQRRARVLLFGIHAAYRRRGIDALLADETFRVARDKGFESAELGWVAEDDTLIQRAVRAVGAKRTKVYRLYSRPIRPSDG